MMRIRKFISCLSILAVACFGGYASTVSASTISVIDASGINVFSATGPTCAGRERGVVISLDCYAGIGQAHIPQADLFTVLRADIGTLAGLAFDHVYLSLTELRTGLLFRGAANVASVDGNIDPLEGSDINAYLRDIDNALATGTSAIGSITGSGIGGHHVLLDVTDAVRRALLDDITGFGLFLTAPTVVPGDTVFGAVGTNYRSGFPTCRGDEDPETNPVACQYMAKSYYELPTLIATRGTEITPFDLLPPRPLPPLTDVPEPGTLFLLLAGVVGMGRVLAPHRKLTSSGTGER